MQTMQKISAKLMFYFKKYQGRHDNKNSKMKIELLFIHKYNNILKQLKRCVSITCKHGT